MKLRGFGHNKRAYCCIMCVAGVLEVTQTKSPLQSKQAAPFLFTSVNALLFSAASAAPPVGAGSLRRVNIHLGPTPETVCTLHYACD